MPALARTEAGGVASGRLALPTLLALPTEGAAPRRKWEEGEVGLLRALYPGADPVPALAARLGRSVNSVRGKARRLGLRRPKRGQGAPRPADLTPALSLSKPYRLTRLGGRECVWNEDHVRRLIRLWTAGFHHTVISEVLGVGARAASTKATRISLPARKGANLSRDVEAARRLDAAGREVPKALRDAEGKLRLGKHCALTGAWFYGPAGIHTCPEAKQTLHYQRMLGLN